MGAAIVAKAAKVKGEVVSCKSNAIPGPCVQQQNTELLVLLEKAEAACTSPFGPYDKAILFSIVFLIVPMKGLFQVLVISRLCISVSVTFSKRRDFVAFF